MGFQYYQRHEWWRDDNRVHRPRKTARVKDYFFKIAREHGFEANPQTFRWINQAYIDHTPSIQKLGESINDWMRVIHPDNKSSFFIGQKVLQLGGYSSFAFDLIFRIVEICDTTHFLDWDTVFVLRSDYDWAIQEKDCDIEELI